MLYTRSTTSEVTVGHSWPLGSRFKEYRSDAPTTLWGAVQLAKGIAATRRRSATTFDFVGQEVSREVYIRTPQKVFQLVKVKAGGSQ